MTGMISVSVAVIQTLIKAVRPHTHVAWFAYLLPIQAGRPTHFADPQRDGQAELTWVTSLYTEKVESP